MAKKIFLFLRIAATMSILQEQRNPDISLTLFVLILPYIAVGLDSICASTLNFCFEAKKHFTWSTRKGISLLNRFNL